MIYRYLPREVDPLVYNMSIENSGDVSYAEIGGLSEQIRELREVGKLAQSNCTVLYLLVLYLKHPADQSIVFPVSQFLWLYYTYSQKSSLRFSDIFSKQLGIFISNFTRPLYVLIYATLQICIQLSATLTKLCHIKHNHPVHMICSKCSPSAETRAGWSHLIWHNFVTVADN